MGADKQIYICYKCKRPITTSKLCEACKVMKEYKVARLIEAIDDLKFIVKENPYNKGKIDKKLIKQQLAVIKHLVRQFS